MDFFEIRKLAIKYFYNHKNGNDFLWLKKNFDKFQIKSVAEAKNFLPTLQYIFNNFLLKANNERALSIKQYARNNKIEKSEIEIIENQIIKTWLILFSAFDGPYDLNREFASIIIDSQLAHLASLEYITETSREIGYEKLESLPPF
jgi:hypothetical protein